VQGIETTHELELARKPARLAVNFKKAGNSGIFTGFEVLQVENGRWKPGSSPLGVARKPNGTF
jgi:hypothetical protein